jgi:hypothetical protein
VSDSFHLDLTVDGAEWHVRRDDRGQFVFDWVSGVGGFTSRFNTDVTVISVEHAELQIREYMSNVDPETGYLR